MICVCVCVCLFCVDCTGPPLLWLVCWMRCVGGGGVGMRVRDRRAILIFVEGQGRRE